MSSSKVKLNSSGRGASVTFGVSSTYAPVVYGSGVVRRSAPSRVGHSHSHRAECALVYASSAEPPQEKTEPRPHGRSRSRTSTALPYKKPRSSEAAPKSTRSVLRAPARRAAGALHCTTPGAIENTRDMKALTGRECTSGI